MVARNTTLNWPKVPPDLPPCGYKDASMHHSSCCSRALPLNNGLNIFPAEYYYVIWKSTFGLLDIKRNNFIIWVKCCTKWSWNCWAMAKNVFYELRVTLNFELGPPNCNWFLPQSKWMFVPKLKKFLRDILDVHKNGMDGRPKHMVPPAYRLLLLYAGNCVLTSLLWGYTGDEHMVPNPLTINLTISYSSNILAVVSEQADLQGLWMARSQRTQNRQ